MNPDSPNSDFFPDKLALLKAAATLPSEVHILCRGFGSNLSPDPPEDSGDRRIQINCREFTHRIAKDILPAVLANELGQEIIIQTSLIYESLKKGNFVREIIGIKTEQYPIMHQIIQSGIALANIVCEQFLENTPDRAELEQTFQRFIKSR